MTGQALTDRRLWAYSTIINYCKTKTRLPAAYALYFFSKQYSMKIIRAKEKRSYGSGVFHIEILYPGTALGLDDSGYLSIGRIDHASFRPPGVVPMHPHRDDEILSYMRSGLQVHRDSEGHEVRVSNTNLMLMNAGSGVSHEENALEDVEMLQIFMRPYKNGLQPQVQFHEFNEAFSENNWRVVAANDSNAPLVLRVATTISDIRISEGNTATIPVYAGKAHHFLYVFNGKLNIGTETLNKGDSVVFEASEDILLKAFTQSDLVLFQIDNKAVYSTTGMYSGNHN